MGMGFAPTWLHQVNPPASQNHFNHCIPLLLAYKTTCLESRMACVFAGR